MADYIIPANTLHVSTAEAFAKCPRKYFYAYIRGWRPEQDGQALYFGTTWHKFLELLEGGDPDPLTTIMNSEEAKKLDEYDAQLICALGINFMKQYPKWQDRNIAPEVPFSVGLGKTAWTFGGTIDGICGDDGTLVEHKTSGFDISEGSDYWTRLKFNLQILMYSLVTGATEVLYMVVKKPKTTPHKVPILDENGKKQVLSLATGERLYKSAPKLDEDGKKIVKSYSTGERLYKKNGEPLQTARTGISYVEVCQGEPRESATVGESEVLMGIETPVEFGVRVTNDINNRPEEFFVCRHVKLDENMKQEALLQCLSIASEIDAMKAKAELFASAGLDRVNAFRRACNEFNCSHCPYCGLCLEQNVRTDEYNEDEAPEGFVVKK